MDLDIKNCHPTLLLRMVEELSPELHQRCTTWSAYNRHVDEWRQLIAEYLDIPISEAKTHLVKLFYLGRPWREIPPMWKLAAEIHDATHLILNHDNYRHLATKFSDRENPRACRLFYAVTPREDLIIEEISRFLLQKHCKPLTYMFDGMILSVPDKLTCDDVKETLLDLTQKWGIEIKLANLSGGSNQIKGHYRDTCLVDALGWCGVSVVPTGDGPYCLADFQDEIRASGATFRLGSIGDICDGIVMLSHATDHFTAVVMQGNVIWELDGDLAVEIELIDEYVATHTLIVVENGQDTISEFLTNLVGGTRASVGDVRRPCTHLSGHTV